MLVDIPQDLSRADIEYEPRTEPADLPGYKPSTEGNIKQIRIAAKALANAQPAGDLRAAAAWSTPTPREELRELLPPRTSFPVTSTVMGLGAFPAPHEQWLGMLGMHGTRTANYAMDKADLIVAIGARFDDRITGKLSEFAPRAKFVHIDVDPAEISKNVPAHIPIVGDAKRRAAEADPRVPGAADRPGAPRRLVEADPAPGRRSTRCATRTRADAEIKPQFMIEAMYEATEGDAIITSDVGQHQMWAAQYYDFDKPRRWINSGGLGTMGFGLPAAIGAKVACPDEHGRLPRRRRQPDHELPGARDRRRHDIPVKVFLMNNGYMGMVRQWQELFWDGRYSSVEMGAEPRLGEAGRGVRRDRHALRRQATSSRTTMREALETDGPVLLDVRVDQEENCYPMIPAGAAARDMVG